ncbi:MAG: UbiD family decarboxylase [Chloroflexi bacterium]|nr:UbiD family decarboxylase [Chloroflexota bacterium]
MNTRDFIDWARQSQRLVEIAQQVDPYLEQARVMSALDGRVVLFRNLAGLPSWRAVAGICAQREFFAQSLSCSVGQLVERIADAVAHPCAPPRVPDGPCQQQAQTPVDLMRLPIPRYHPADGGRYVTAGIAVVGDPDYGRNVSIHRLMVLDHTHMVARLVEGRGAHTAWKKTTDDLPVAIAVGCPVHVLLAAAISPASGIDEFGIAHALSPTPLVQCQTVDIAVPADAEMVLEGRITHRKAQEGPFPDLTGTMDVVRQQPIIEINRITHRAEPIFHAILPGGLEHRQLMGMPREPTILAAVNRVCRCTGVYITPGGVSWLHAVVQIDKQTDDDGRNAIEAAFSGHSSLKHVVVVDQDVDIYSSDAVEWAIATRFQADCDLVILKDQSGSSLDPSAEKSPGQKTRTAKMGLDATAPLGSVRTEFERVGYAPVDLEQYGVNPTA